MDTPSDIYSACASPSPCASELGDNGLAHDFCAAPKPSLVGRTYQRYSKDQQRRLVVGGIPFRLRRAQITPGAAVTPTSTGANGATPQEESAASQRLATKVESTEQEHKVKTNNSNSSSKSHPPQGTDGRDDDTPVEAVPLARNRFFLDILTVGAGRRDEWILPKGGWESFETLHEGAIREVLEEAGVRRSRLPALLCSPLAQRLNESCFQFLAPTNFSNIARPLLPTIFRLNAQLRRVWESTMATMVQTQSELDRFSV